MGIDDKNENSVIREEDSCEENKNSAKKRRRALIITASVFAVTCSNMFALLIAVLIAKYTGRILLSLSIMLIIITLSYTCCVLAVKKIIGDFKHKK